MANEQETLGFIDAAMDTMEGFEEVNAATTAIPFLKLAQDLTPQTKKHKAEYIDGLEPGMLFNSATSEILGNNIDVIIMKFERVYIEWKPNRGGFVGYHSPEHAEKIAVDTSAFGKWQTEEGNELQEYYTYYALIVGRELEGPVILSLSSAGIKVAKQLNRLMTTHLMDDGKRALPYYLVWNMSVVHLEKGEYDWFQHKFTFSRYIDEEQYSILGPERKALPSKPVDYAQIEDRTPRESLDEDDSDL